MNAKLIFGMILAGLAAIFIFQNTAMMELKFLFWTLSASMTLTMLLIFSSGIIAGWLLRGTFRRKKRNAPTKHAAVVAE